MSARRDAAIAHLSEAMEREHLYEVHRYDDSDGEIEFTVIEFGDPLEGRAFTVTCDGVIDETDR